MNKKIWFINGVLVLIGFGTLVLMFQNAIMTGEKVWIGLLTMCSFGCGLMLPIYIKQTIEIENQDKNLEQKVIDDEKKKRN